jgi:hypothetical protein
MDQKTQRSRVFPPTLCHGVARIFLTAPLSYDAVALHRGQCEQLLRYVKLATSSYAVVESRIKKGIESPWGGKTLCLSHSGYTS